MLPTCPNLRTFQVLSCLMWLLMAITLDNVAVENHQLHVPLHLSSNIQLQNIKPYQFSLLLKVEREKPQFQFSIVFNES